MKIITNPFECGYADTEPNYRDDICRHPKAAGLLCPGELTFPKDCPLPDVPTIQSHQVEKEQGAPFDEAIYNPECKECGHQNSVNCNTCRILNPQFE